jgi:hypothetical protein
MVTQRTVNSVTKVRLSHDRGARDRRDDDDPRRLHRPEEMSGRVPALE